MNVILLITLMFALVLVHGHNRRPCQRNPDSNAYNSFVRRHIVHGCFNRRSKQQWRRYLIKYGLCAKRTWRSFIEEKDQGRVVQICNGFGQPVYPSYQGDLCISNSTMLVYDIKIGRWGYCKIRRVVQSIKPAVVACDTVVSRCLPVRLERYTNQRPDRRARPCRPGC